MTSNKANIIEIFSSVQGEGPYVGYRQLFIRFALCNLNCAYCDTKFPPQKYCKIELHPGSGSFKQVENPVNTAQLIQEINRLNCLHHHSLSLTGGEPLINSEFIQSFLKEFKNTDSGKNLKIYLETNGTLPDELEKIIDKIDIISMDFKIESSYGKPAPWSEHQKFISVAQENNKEIFAKIVITSKINPDEIAKIIDLILNIEQKIPIILQPVTSENKDLVPTPAKLMEIQEMLLGKLIDVRIIPQMHKYLDLL